MGSLNPDGSPILKLNNTSTHRHLGHIIKERRSEDDALVSTASVTGEIRFTNIDMIGVAHQPDNAFAFTSGLSLQKRLADNSVEVEKYTVDGSTSGNLGWQYTRQIDGIHTSVSEVESPPTAPSAPVTVTERKIFYTDDDRGRSSGFDDWEIFDASGVAVGATIGVTDTDITPAATFAGASGETPV